MQYSPVLAMVTAAFEIGAAVWVLRGPGRKAVLRTTAAILFFLAGYQVVEVAICSLAPGYGFLPRLAFTVVTCVGATSLSSDLFSRCFHGPVSCRDSSEAAPGRPWRGLDPARNVA
jgi:hypothetical protein